MNKLRRSDTDDMLARLLDVAIDHFGEHGFQGSATREIARDAGTLMSSITYHYKGKKGLYAAAADLVSSRLDDLIAPALKQSDEICKKDGTPAQARAALHVLAQRLIEVMIKSDHRALARFYVTHRAVSSEGFQRVQAGLMGNLYERWIVLLRRVSVRPLLDIEAHLRAHAMIGQIIAFRPAYATRLNRLAWAEVQDAEIDFVQDIISEHIDAILDKI